MKSAIVPAQITTIEDKIAGNLNLAQMLLLTAPVVSSSLIYVALPPFMGTSAYKLLLGIAVAGVFGLLAIRIRGRLVMEWVRTIGRYNLRPKYYVLDKNDMHLRDACQVVSAEADATPGDEALVITPSPTPITTESVMLEGIISNPQAKLRFNADRKGGLSVRITEIK